MEDKRMLAPQKALSLFGIRGLQNRPVVCRLINDVTTEVNNITYVFSRGEIAVVFLRIGWCGGIFMCGFQLFEYGNVDKITDNLLRKQHDASKDALNIVSNIKTWCLFDDDSLPYHASVEGVTASMNINETILTLIQKFFEQNFEILDKESLALIGFQKAYNILLETCLREAHGMFSKRKIRRALAWADMVVVEALRKWIWENGEDKDPVSYVEETAAKNGRIIHLIPPAEHEKLPYKEARLQKRE